MQEWDKDQLHALSVTRLSVQLFDELTELHGYGMEERTLLECASLLHDIGWCVSGKKHHKHSMQLILQSNISSFTEREKLLVANIARYHRRALPKFKHNEFAMLSPGDQHLVRHLASLLRIADGLDRSHTAKIKKVECTRDTRSCYLMLECIQSSNSEIMAANKKKDLFEQTYGLSLKIEKKPPNS